MNKIRCLNPRLGNRPIGVPCPAMNLCNFCINTCSPLGLSPARYGVGTFRIPGFMGESLL